MKFQQKQHVAAIGDCLHNIGSFTAEKRAGGIIWTLADRVQTPGENSLLRMQPILGLVEDH